MPRFRVVEVRAYRSKYLIDAEDEQAAKNLNGAIIDSLDTDSWGESLESIEEVGEDEEEID